jgi:hypothetical protein
MIGIAATMSIAETLCMERNAHVQTSVIFGSGCLAVAALAMMLQPMRPDYFELENLVALWFKVAAAVDTGAGVPNAGKGLRGAGLGAGFRPLGPAQGESSIGKGARHWAGSRLSHGMALPWQSCPRVL